MLWSPDKCLTGSHWVRGDVDEDLGCLQHTDDHAVSLKANGPSMNERGDTVEPAAPKHESTLGEEK